MLLITAKALAERGRFDGTVNLIFQPAEEYGLADSGAARMIADGLFERYPATPSSACTTCRAIPRAA